MQAKWQTEDLDQSVPSGTITVCDARLSEPSVDVVPTLFLVSRSFKCHFLPYSKCKICLHPV